MTVIELFLSQVFNAHALTVKTTKSNEEPKTNFPYLWNCYPFLRLIQEKYLTIQSKRIPRKRHGYFQSWGNVGKGSQISIYTDKFWWHHLVTSCYRPSSSLCCQILLPSGSLCTFLVFGSCKVILLFLVKLTQGHQGREEPYSLFCNWRKLKIGIEVERHR